jgi:hypothetical protein
MMTNTTTAAATGEVRVHVFERAGLGVAPFRYGGMTELVFVAHPGAAPRAGGSCDYCGACIRYACVIKSSDGKTFKVGTDCVHKTGDAGLRRVVSEAEAQLRRDKAEAKRQRDIARIQAANDRLVELVDAWKAQPHPQAETSAWVRERNLSRFDWAEWMMANAGITGRLVVAKAVEAALAGPK